LQHADGKDGIALRLFRINFLNKRRRPLLPFMPANFGLYFERVNSQFMKEISDIISAYKAAQAQGLQTALATVVQVEGSSYRREGARMLITETGQLTGAISGGCLEGDALRKALSAMAQQQPMLVTYDTNDEDDAKLGLGLGCNGIIHILIEPINAAEKKQPGNPAGKGTQ